MCIRDSDVISTYVYRRAFESGDYSFSAAVGLFNSVINFTIIMLFNLSLIHIFALIKKYGGWKDRRMVDAYAHYCEVLFQRFRGKVKYLSLIHIFAFNLHSIVYPSAT